MEFSQKTVNGILIISIKGQIRIATQIECKEYFDQLIKEHGCNSVVLDLSGVGYMNSAGIGMIVECFKKLKEDGCTFVLCSLVPDIAKLFEVTKLDRFIKIYRNEEEAIHELTANQ